MEVTEVQKITQNVIAEASKVVIAGEAVVEKQNHFVYCDV